MKTKPKIEETLQLPTDDALEQALSYLQNSFSSEEVSLKDIKKAVECIDKGSKEPDNLLPETNDDENELLESSEQNLEEELEETISDEENIEDDNNLLNENDIKVINDKISEVFTKLQDGDTDNKLIETTHEISNLNLPHDSKFEKEMDDTILKSTHAFQTLFDYAVNASSAQGAADIASASQSFLKLAFDASQAKLKHKLDIHKSMLEERKVKLQELKAFKDTGNQLPESDNITSTEQITGIKMTPSLREELINQNLPKNNN